VCKAISSVVWTEAIIILVVSWFHNDWLSLIQNFNNIQLLMTAIKYIPQVYFNFTRKSTVGWSISNILLDLTGGTSNFAQMLTQSIDQNSFVNFSGNIGKVGLSVLSVFFDIVFTVQHFCLYTQHSEVTPEDYIRVGDYSIVASVDPELAVGEQDEGDHVQKTPPP
jgi:cystinosin